MTLCKSFVTRSSSTKLLQRYVNHLGALLSVSTLLFAQCFHFIVCSVFPLYCLLSVSTLLLMAEEISAYHQNSIDMKTDRSYMQTHVMIPRLILLNLQFSKYLIYMKKMRDSNFVIPQAKPHRHTKVLMLTTQTTIIRKEPCLCGSSSFVKSFKGQGDTFVQTTASKNGHLTDVKDEAGSVRSGRKTQHQFGARNSRSGTRS